MRIDALDEIRSLINEARTDLGNAWGDRDVDDTRRDALIQSAIAGALLAIAKSQIAEYDR